jgi:hypothetical protein
VSATRRRASTGFRPRHLFALAGILLLVLVAGSFYAAFAASATVAPSSVGYQSSNFSVTNLKPAECTVSVSSIVAGSGTINATAQNQLVLGSSSADTVSLQKNDCFVGGGPTSGTKDSVIGQNGQNNGDQCIVTSGATVSRCTVVATRP